MQDAAQGMDQGADVRAAGGDEVLDTIKGAMAGLTAFGEPVRHGGVVVIPASRVFGGGGVGEAGRGRAEGEGGGFGGLAVPAGAFVITEDGAVSWRPARDLVVRAAAGAAVVAVILGWRALARRR